MTRSWPMSHPIFATAHVCIWIAMSIGWFYVVNWLDPFHPIDVPFFFRLYIAIGGMAGLLTWYCARLVCLGHVKMRALIACLAIPFAFLLFVSLDQGPLMLLPIFAILGSTLLFAGIATRKIAGGIAMDAQDRG